jgi:SMI1-KNR4 cell-wall
MELKLTQRGTKLTKKAIDSFKSKLAIELPSDYQDFVSSNNGGTATGYWFRSKRARRYINTFFAITPSPRGPMTIGRVMENCREILPTQSLPIAYVDGDNLLLLRVDAKKFGQIDLYVDCESAAATKGIHRVAKTFGEFLKGLQYTDPAELDDDDYGLW